MTTNLVVLGLALLLTTRCVPNIGDPPPVTLAEYRNPTDQNVMVYPYGHQFPAVRFLLGPHEVRSIHDRPTRIEADDAQGHLIFCQQLGRSDWGTPGQLGCPAPSPSSPVRVSSVPSP